MIPSEWLLQSFTHPHPPLSLARLLALACLLANSLTPCVCVCVCVFVFVHAVTRLVCSHNAPPPTPHTHHHNTHSPTPTSSRTSQRCLHSCNTNVAVLCNWVCVLCLGGQYQGAGRAWRDAVASQRLGGQVQEDTVGKMVSNSCTVVHWSSRHDLPVDW
jgi:hypothetical protein